MAASGFSLRAVRVDHGTGSGLFDLDLEVRPGEVVALVGPSGSGKTTLLELLNGVRSPDAGAVSVDGRALAGLSAASLRAVRAGIGFVPQEPGLVPERSAAFNVLSGRLGTWGLWAGLRRTWFPRDDDLEEAWSVLRRLGIGDLVFRRVDTLSGGERQRVAVARALFARPAALLADEPLTALDPERARETVALLLEVAAQDGLTLVVTLHDAALAGELVPRLVGLRAGRVLFDRPAARVDAADFARLYRLEPDA